MLPHTRINQAIRHTSIRNEEFTMVCEDLTNMFDTTAAQLQNYDGKASHRYCARP